MRKRIFRSFAILIVVAIVLTFAAMEYISYQEAYANTKDWAREDAELLAELVDEFGQEAVNEDTVGIIDGRVTFIAQDGTVLFDSNEDSSLMENHLERPEVQQAFESGTGSATRFSQTFGTQTYYYACQTSDGSVIRTSRTMETVLGEVFARLGIAVGILVLLMVLELFLAKSVTGRIVAPINAINLSAPKEAEKSEPVYEELSPLLDRIEVQNEQIRMQMEELKQAEVVRREFTANVSHELKTPLMSISGYAELIENDLAKPEDIKGFAGRIHSEAVRLKNLVEDIIRLSSLEGAQENHKKETLDFYEICDEVRQTLAPYAGEQGISLEFSGEHMVFYASRQALFEMVYNLCDNALKYNKPAGSVMLSLQNAGGRPLLRVKDTGIGISPEDQGRIFERFYRVDKSHSRQTGGTGLGLSIVKHAAMLHEAQISVDSTPGEGTEISVIFPPVA